MRRGNEALGEFAPRRGRAPPPALGRLPVQCSAGSGMAEDDRKSMSMARIYQETDSPSTRSLHNLWWDSPAIQRKDGQAGRQPPKRQRTDLQQASAEHASTGYCQLGGTSTAGAVRDDECGKCGETQPGGLTGLIGSRRVCARCQAEHRQASIDSSSDDDDDELLFAARPVRNQGRDSAAEPSLDRDLRHGLNLDQPPRQITAVEKQALDNMRSLREQKLDAELKAKLENQSGKQQEASTVQDSPEGDRLQEIQMARQQIEFDQNLQRFLWDHCGWTPPSSATDLSPDSAVSKVFLIYEHQFEAIRFVAGVARQWPQNYPPPEDERG